MTATGLILLPLTAFLLFGPWRWLIVFLTITSGVFADAAAVNFSSFGVQPGYCVLLVVVARAGAEMVLRREPIRRDILAVFFPLLILIAAALVALFIGSSFYDGDILVQSSRDGIGTSGTLFHFRLENYAQNLYIFADTLGALCIAHKLSRMPLSEAQRVVNEALYGFILVGSATVTWQWLHFTTGMFFPAESFFHDNLAYAQAYGQTFANGYRLSGAFAEPSALAYYFAGCLLFSYRQYEAEKSNIALVGLILSLFLLIVSTSTSAYVVVAFFCACAAYRQRAVFGGLIISGVTSLKARPLHLIVFVVVGAAALTLLARYRDAVLFVVREFIIEKPNTGSLAERSAADLMAVRVTLETWGIGLGLGSHKANTLPLTLASNVGVVGLGAFVWFVAASFKHALRGALKEPGMGRLVLPIAWFLSGSLLLDCVMNPNFNILMFWVVIGLLVGTASVGTHRPETSDSAVQCLRFQHAPQAVTASGPASRARSPHAGRNSDEGRVTSNAPLLVAARRPTRATKAPMLCRIAGS